MGTTYLRTSDFITTSVSNSAIGSGISGNSLLYSAFSNVINNNIPFPGGVVLPNYLSRLSENVRILLSLPLKISLDYKYISGDGDIVLYLPGNYDLIFGVRFSTIRSQLSSANLALYLMKIANREQLTGDILYSAYINTIDNLAHTIQMNIASQLISIEYDNQLYYNTPLSPPFILDNIAYSACNSTNNPLSLQIDNFKVEKP